MPSQSSFHAAITRTNRCWNRGIASLKCQPVSIRTNKKGQMRNQNVQICTGHNQRWKFCGYDLFCRQMKCLLIEKFFYVRILSSSREILLFWKMPKRTLETKTPLFAPLGVLMPIKFFKPRTRVFGAKHASFPYSDSSYFLLYKYWKFEIFYSRWLLHLLIHPVQVSLSAKKKRKAVKG